MSFSVVLCTVKTMCYIHCYLIEMTMVINFDADDTIVLSQPLTINATLLTDKYR